MIGFILKSAFFFLLIAVGFLAYEYSRLPDVSALRIKNPSTTALMELRKEEYGRKRMRVERKHIWVSYGAISPHLKKAVLVSEDATFFRHKGVDFYELREAVREDLEERKFKRGASTITMQVAKNLYLSPEKTPLRKIREVMITFRMERLLSKERIFEIYLNVAEWGRGIYGAEAASRHYFYKRAARLNPSEAATLAALLPDPRNPRARALRYRKNLILSRLARIGHIDDEEFERATRMPLFPQSLGFFDRILSVP